ncbi:MAG: M20 family metallopeptidase [Actinobacteria bacterium]|nr:M20 family metallopeptidase [Actinomycetota bacterium]
MPDVDVVKSAIVDNVDSLADRLIEVSRSIHARPELNFKERFAHDLLCDQLASAGVEVTRHAYGVETAFEAVVGDVGPEALVLLEYDALPGIGHGCGHNIIAAAGLGAGLAVAGFASQLGGRVRILGTPAEEGGGGKIYMARNGAFATGDAAMMIHPADADLLRMHSLAVHTLDVEYTGRAAHAAAAPWEGRNALDAAVLGYVNMAALRQHIRPTERVHGIITEGGEKPNVVPRRAAANWYVRSDTMESLQPLKGRVLACLEGATSACGCTMSATWDDVAYAEVRDNQAMVSAYVRNMASLGREVHDPDLIGRRVTGSTDMGNVSYLLPSIHPMVKAAPDGTAIHTEEFARHAGSESGDRAVLAGAKAMAMLVVDLWTDPALLAEARQEFSRVTSTIDVLGVTG